MYSGLCLSSQNMVAHPYPVLRPRCDRGRGSEARNPGSHRPSCHVYSEDTAPVVSTTTWSLAFLSGGRNS